MINGSKMTKGERVELTQLIRKRERVMKKDAEEYSIRMMADFEEQSAKIYSFDDDEIWKQAAEIALAAVGKANIAIAKRCGELGIPAEFAPSLEAGWAGRGQNAVASRRAELRRVAASKVKTILADAVAKIERMSLNAQTEVVSNGLESQSARDFLEKLPSMETLMPSLSVEAVQQSLAEKKRRPAFYLE
jgi:hypothetical protein